MISHGDELGRTQRGNNNAYCQDNEITWIDWDLDADRQTLLEFASKLVQFRRAQPVLRRRKYFQGRNIRGGQGRRLARAGRPRDGRRGVAVRLRAHARHAAVGQRRSRRSNERGEPIIGDTVLVLLNAPHRQGAVHAARASRPAPAMAARARHRSTRWARNAATKPARQYPLQGRSVAVFKILAHAARTAPRVQTSSMSRRGRNRLASQELIDADARGRRPSRRTSSTHRARRPRAPRRVVIERVRPEIDGGRFPIKRTLGESVEVAATIFADGHDVIAAVLRDRSTTQRRARGARRATPWTATSRSQRSLRSTRDGWQETPMTLDAPGPTNGARASSSTPSGGTSIRSSPGSIDS